MRRTFALLLVMGLFAWPGAAAQADPMVCFRVDTANCADEVSIDLVDDSGSRVRIEVDSARFAFTPQTVTAFLDCACGSKRLSMAQDAGTWRASVAVDDIDLVAGDWNVTPQATGPGGQTQTLDSKTLHVTHSTDDGPPRLTIEGLEDGLLTLGAGGLLRINVNETLPGKVTYRADWMPTKPFELKPPYSVSVGTFRPGAQEVTVTANDRTGNHTTTTFTVFADARDPEVGVSPPAAFYQGIPNTLKVTVKEHSSYTVHASVGGGNASATRVGDATAQDVYLNITPTALGASLLRIHVTDQLGNDVVLESPSGVTKLETDAVLVDVAPEAPAIRGERAKLNVSAFQKDPLAPVTFTVTFDGQPLGELHVPVNRTASATLSAAFEPGRHTGLLRLEPPASVTERNFTDQERILTIEVFLARVIHGDQTYHIRADDRGLPLEAVGANGRIHTLQTQDSGLGTVYAFNADGQELYWNPATNTTIVPQQTTTTAPDNESPGLPLLGLAAMVGAAAWVARRR